MTEDAPITRGEARNAAEGGVPAIPAGCRVVWTEDQATGEQVRWHAVPIAPGSLPRRTARYHRAGHLRGRQI